MKVIIEYVKEPVSLHQKINLKSWAITDKKITAYKKKMWPERALTFTWRNHFNTYINYDRKEHNPILNPTGDCKLRLLYGILIEPLTPYYNE